MRKRIIIILLLSMCLLTTTVNANIEDSENINLDEILQTASAQAIPQISSRIALVYDRASGKVLYEKNGYKQTKMASTTKIMTTIIVLENNKNTVRELSTIINYIEQKGIKIVSLEKLLEE